MYGQNLEIEFLIIILSERDGVAGSDQGDHIVCDKCFPVMTLFRKS